MPKSHKIQQTTTNTITGMTPKNPRLATAYRSLYVVMCTAALVLEFGFMRGEAHLYALNYYTVLSNIACVVFFVAMLSHPRRPMPRTEGAILFCIAITGIIYATMLAPAAIDSGSFFSFRNMALHYVGPAMVVVDWLLFCPKGRLRVTDPLLWLFIPLGYFCYILLRSTFVDNIGPADSAFPYPFIDPATRGGWGPMLGGVGVIAIGMAALGYLILLLDRLLAKKQ